MTYLSLIVSPGVHAMQQSDPQQSAQDPAAQDARNNIGKALGRAKQELRVLAGRPDVLDHTPTREDKDAAKAALLAWRTETQALIDQVRAELVATGDLIESRNLPDAIPQRHGEALAKFDSP